MTTEKDIKNELLEDLEATGDEAETVKGGGAKGAKFMASKKVSFFRKPR